MVMAHHRALTTTHSLIIPLRHRTLTEVLAVWLVPHYEAYHQRKAYDDRKISSIQPIEFSRQRHDYA
jgi:hypothetical protein